MLNAWLLRPMVWFAVASMAMTSVHELTHAVVAYALGVRSTLYGYLVDVDLAGVVRVMVSGIPFTPSRGSLSVSHPFSVRSRPVISSRG
jgi:hypothetical protein